MVGPMRRWMLALTLMLAIACGSSDEHLADATSSSDATADDDAPAADASGGDATPIDAGRDGAIGTTGVLCARADQACTEPTPICCDVSPGLDTCIASGGACSGERLACDGPEDCPFGDECCLFQGQGSRCIPSGVCGTTGAISNEMCHVQDDCAPGLTCCGTAPGPALDLYAICTPAGCPQ